MAQLFTASNSKLYISDKPVNAKDEVSVADFADTVWVQVKGLQTLGELGGEQNINTFELLDSPWAQKTKGIRDGGTMSNVFVMAALDPGHVKFREAIENCKPYQFKLVRGADCVDESTVTIASGGVVTWTNSNFSAGQPVILEGAGLPTEFTAGTVYYVIADSLTANSFKLSATDGGAAITTTAAGTGTITGSAPPAGMTKLFQGYASDGPESGGGNGDLYTQTWPIAINGRILTV